MMRNLPLRRLVVATAVAALWLSGCSSPEMRQAYAVIEEVAVSPRLHEVARSEGPGTVFVDYVVPPSPVMPDLVTPPRDFVLDPELIGTCCPDGTIIRAWTGPSPNRDFGCGLDLIRVRRVDWLSPPLEEDVRRRVVEGELVVLRLAASCQLAPLPSRPTNLLTNRTGATRVKLFPLKNHHPRIRGTSSTRRALAQAGAVGEQPEASLG